MSDFSEIFDRLVTDRKLIVNVSGSTAESLRTSLIRKWTQKKTQYEQLGFLPPEWEKLSISCRKLRETVDGVETCVTEFSLVEKKRSMQYLILPQSQQIASSSIMKE